MSFILQPTIHPTALDVRTQYLYRIFDASGSLLYVGITCDLGVRFDQHRRDKPWWHQKHSHTIEEAPSRADVMFREARAILTEHPRHNKDIPTMARFDELRSRIIADGEGLTAVERVGILEHQLRQSQRRARSAEAALTSVRSAPEHAHGAEVASARQVAATWKERAEKAEARETESRQEWSENSKSLHELIGYWRERAEGTVLPRTFIVEGPRMADGSLPRVPAAPACTRPHAVVTPDPAVPAPVQAPAAPPRRGLFGRLFGS